MTERGFLLIDKPEAWTSHDVVAKARTITGIRKIGHAGTLDPLATGLVILGVGRATKLIRFIQDLPKEYVGRVRFGVGTDSLDADGAETWRRPMPFDREALEAVIPQFVGPLMQVPPMVSALKQGGKRLHELARAGIEVDRPPRPVVIHSLELLDFTAGDFPEAVVRVHCSKGTYVRSLADDLAQSLGGHAHLTALRRLGTGSLNVTAAVTLDTLEASVPAWTDHLLSPGEALSDFPGVDLDGSSAAAVSNGARIPRVEGHSEGDLIRMMSGSDMLAMYRVEGIQMVSEVILT